jgi:phage/plasmid-like protein (TIGR03299 family)
MAHNVDYSTGEPAVAYIGKPPWHEQGKKLNAGTPIETWIKAACLDWQIMREPVRYCFKDEIREMPNQQVLIRSDNGAPLSVVSDSYCIVQPKEVIEFYRDLVDDSAFSLETAGALDEGRKVWGLARSNNSKNILDNKDDSIDAFLLLASSCDKSLATTVAFTSIRVVCQNTLNFAMEQIKGKAQPRCFKIAHNRQFNWDEAKKKLNLIDNAWSDFIKKVDQFAKTKIEPNDIDKFFESLYLSGKKDDEKLSRNAIIEIQNLKSALVNAPGRDLPTAKDTVWGLVNAVTYYVDHKRKSNNQSTRLDSAWFGSGALLKEKAWETAINMFPKAA